VLSCCERIDSGADVFHLVGNPSPPSGTERLSDLAREAHRFHLSMSEYRPTPCHQLDSLAEKLGIGSLLLKDESHRFGLNAFKGLGASFAIDRWLRENSPTDTTTFVTATDGNHGRAVAWSARRAGHRAVVYIPSHAKQSRVDSIRAEGAEVVLVSEGYDAAVRLVRAHAADRGWVAIQDTANDHYHTVPEWIAAGYWTHARELEPQTHALPDPTVDLVLLQAGVGTWASAMVAYYWHRYGRRRPKIVVVEPVSASCVMAGAVAGAAQEIESPDRTIMAGLDCALASTAGVKILKSSVDAFITVEDKWAIEAMRILANPTSGDPMVVSGESGAAGLAGLMALKSEPGLAAVSDALGLGPTSRTLVWSTEGATDPVHWTKVVGRAIPA
jgi:diaminopropionate ammonia-lyase